jgi:hypothetical protein
MNDCCNGSSDQKECCKAAVEAYKQEIVKQQEAAGAAEVLVQVQEEYEAIMMQSASSKVTGLAVLSVLTLIAIVFVSGPPDGVPRIISVPIFFVSCVLFWRARKKLKMLEKEQQTSIN